MPTVYLITRARKAVALCLLPALCWLAGCSSGSSSISNPGNTGSSTNQVAGNVSDVNSSPIVGAAVSGAGQTATSTQQGAFVLPSVTVPAGQSSSIVTITASKTIAGVPWSGENTVEVLNGTGPTSNANVVMSPVSTQATVTGQITDQNGSPLAGARVFMAPGPVSSTSGGVTSQYFSSLGSFTTYTNTSGRYTLPMIPTVTADGTQSAQIYTVSASFAGYINQTTSNVTLTAGQTAALNFTLTASSSGSTQPLVSNLDASMFTVPVVPTRAAGATAQQIAYQNIIDALLLKRGIQPGHQAASRNVQMHTRNSMQTRSVPSGSIIETNITWNYQASNSLFGFDILRADNLTNAGAPNFFSEALLRDSLADQFFDTDPAFTPGQVYYYNVAPLDTILFPQNGTEPTPDPNATMQVSPLSPLSLQSPIGGQTVSSQPVLAWSSISNIGQYTVLIYNQFPDYQSTTDGVSPIVTQTLPPATTSYTPSAPLASGTYYWFVIAQYTPPTRNTGYAYSISPIGSFVVP